MFLPRQRYAASVVDVGFFVLQFTRTSRHPICAIRPQSVVYWIYRRTLRVSFFMERFIKSYDRNKI